MKVIDIAAYSPGQSIVPNRKGIRAVKAGYSRLAEMVADGAEGCLIGCYSRVIIYEFKICQIIEIGFIHVRQESFEI